MKFNKLSQQRLFHKTNLCSHITTQHSRCKEMWSVDQLKPAFKSLFTVFLYLSLILSPLSLSLSLSFCISLPSQPVTLSHICTQALLFLFYSFFYTALSLTLSLSHMLSVVSLTVWCKALSGQQNALSVALLLFQSKLLSALLIWQDRNLCCLALLCQM